MGGVLGIDSDNAARDWLAGLRAVYFSSVTPVVEFAMPFLTDAENRSLGREALRLRNACGCSQAGFAMTVTMLAFAYHLASDGMTLAATPWSTWVIAALAVATATSLAKIGTLMLAHRRLIALAEQICLPRELRSELAIAEV